MLTLTATATGLITPRGAAADALTGRVLPRAVKSWQTVADAIEAYAADSRESFPVSGDATAREARELATFRATRGL